MRQYDKGLLTKQQLDKFKLWLEVNGQTVRPGKGEFQIMQISLPTGWGAVCRDAKGVISTPQEVRPMVELFKAGSSLIAPPPKNPGGQPATSKANDALRDEFAMLAAEKLMPTIDDIHMQEDDRSVELLLQSQANACYTFADCMLKARAKSWLED